MTIRRCHDAISVARFRHFNINARTREDDSIDSTQRKMLRLIVQKSRKFEKRTKKDKEKDTTDDQRNDTGLPPESEEEKCTSTGHDHVSSVSLESDTDDNCIRFIKRSTGVAEDKMRTLNIFMLDRSAKGGEMATIYEKERWTAKTARWNPNLYLATRTNRSVGRPKKRRDDDL